MSQPTPPARAFVLTDIEGSTSLWEADPRAMRAALDVHDRVLRSAISAHHGTEVRNEGDGFVVTFDQVADAIAFAAGIAPALDAAHGTAALRVRVGVHVGRALERRTADGRTEWYGPALHVAAQTRDAAHGGQVLLTDDARREAGAIAARDLGVFAIGGVTGTRLWELYPREAGAFPPPRARRGRRTNVATPLDVFVGRLRERAEVDSTGPGIATLCGPGGVGKTRLALEFAHEAADRYDGGVWVANLGAATSALEACAAVASALDVALAGEPTGQLASALRARGRLVLVLDGCDGCLESLAPVVARWSRIAPEATLVLTSRSPSSAPGERVIPIAPLDSVDAIELFRLRARAVRSDFDAPEEEIVALADALDRLPLALELAAARVGLLSVRGLLERLAHRFALLDGARPAERGLRAVLDASWALLSDGERSALARASVFVDGCEPDAARAVTLADDATIASLARCSLVTVTGRRHVLPANVRAYAAEKLGPDPTEVEALHGAYFAKMGSDAAILGLDARGGDPTRSAIGRDLGNLRAATARAVRRGDAATAAATARAACEWLLMHGPLGEAAALLEPVIALSRDRGPTEALALALTVAALVDQARGRMADAVERSLEVVALAERLGDAYRLVLARCNLAVALHAAGRGDEAQARYEELASVPDLPGPTRVNLLGNLGLLLDEQGRPGPAADAIEQAIALADAIGYRRVEAQLLSNLGGLHLDRRDDRRARLLLERAQAIQRDIGDAVSEAQTLANLGICDIRDRRTEAAMARFEQAMRTYRLAGNLPSEGAILQFMGTARSAEGHAGEARDLYLRAAAIFRETGDRRREGMVVGDLGVLEQNAGRRDAAWDHYTRAIEIHRDIGNRRWEGMALQQRAGVDWQRGNFESCAADVRAAEPLLRDAGEPVRLARLLVVRGRLEHLAGDVERARSTLTEAVRVYAESGVSDALADDDIADLRGVLDAS